MASERTFQDRVQKSRDLAAGVAVMTPAYAPADAQFALTALNTAIAAAETASADVDTKKIAYTDATSDRYTLAKAIGPLITQSLAYVKSNSAWATRYAALKDVADKVRGVRPPKAKPVNPDPAAKPRESGEQSYAEMTGFFKTYIDRLRALTGYLPPDVKITIDALDGLHSDLDAWNKSIPTTERVLTDAISDRQLAFTGPAGLKPVFDGVKTSVKGQYGQSSPQYQSISAIRW